MRLKLLTWLTLLLFAAFSTSASACALHCVMNPAGPTHAGMHVGDGPPANAHALHKDGSAQSLPQGALTDGPLCHCIAIGQPSTSPRLPSTTAPAAGHDRLSPQFGSHITGPPEPPPKSLA